MPKTPQYLPLPDVKQEILFRFVFYFLVLLLSANALSIREVRVVSVPFIAKLFIDVVLLREDGRFLKKTVNLENVSLNNSPDDLINEVHKRVTEAMTREPALREVRISEVSWTEPTEMLMADICRVGANDRRKKLSDFPGMESLVKDFNAKSKCVGISIYYMRPETVSNALGDNRSGPARLPSVPQPCEGH